MPRGRGIQMKESEITTEELANYLIYYQDTGLFIRRIATSQNTKAGELAGNIDSLGYRVIGILGIQIRAHRIAYKLMTGEWPPAGFDIDHVNGIKDDNSWDNLRLATRGQNRRNIALSVANKSGVKGVSWHKATSTWRVCVMLDKKQYSGGYFTKLEDAEYAAKQLRAKLHKEYSHDG